MPHDPVPRRDERRVARAPQDGGIVGKPVVTSIDIRNAMYGISVVGLRVVRQAWRISDTDTEELALIAGRSSSWVAHREADRLVIWAYGDEDEAEFGFDDRLRAPGHEWRVAQPAAAPVAG